jgi:predicted transcriptional regulator
MLTLLGLKDDYQTDGRAVVEPLFDWAVPQTLRAHRETLLRLGEVYKQVTASFGSFAMYTLVASTKALASGSSTDDSTYTTIEGKIADLTTQRDALMAQIRTGLNNAQFAGQALNEQQAKDWIASAQSLIDQAKALAAGS